MDYLHLIVRGELFLISAGISADAIGRALVGGDSKPELRILNGFFCGVLLLINSIYFGDLAYKQDQQSEASKHRIETLEAAARLRNFNEVLPSDPNVQNEADESQDGQRVAYDSLWLFGSTVVAAFGAILMEED